VSLYSIAHNNNDILNSINSDNPIQATELIKTNGITRDFFA
jgi:hypothetical protein